jgi:hypothetical protein
VSIIAAATVPKWDLLQQLRPGGHGRDSPFGVYEWFSPRPAKLFEENPIMSRLKSDPHVYLKQLRNRERGRDGVAAATFLNGTKRVTISMLRKRIEDTSNDVLTRLFASTLLPKWRTRRIMPGVSRCSRLFAQVLC